MTELNTMTWQQDVRAALAADAEADAMAIQMQRDAELAHQAGVEAAADAASKAATDAVAAEVLTMEPPDTIAVVTNGLSPQRARLVRFSAWLATLEAEHTSLLAGRAKYLAEMKVPAMTEAAIKKLVADDKTGLLAMMGGTVSKHQLRSAERAKLVEKLANDSHAAEVAGAAIDECDRRLDRLSTEISVLRDRHEAFVADALQEHLIATAGAKMIGHADVLRQSALTTMGAFGCLQALRGVSHHARPHQISLPTPRLPGEMWNTGDDERPGYAVSSGSGYTISFPVHEQEAVERKWMGHAKALLADPHADLSGDA